MIDPADQHSLNALRAELASECGVMPSEITVHVCGVNCEHVWDGQVVEFEDGCGETASCSKCGELAINWAMRNLP
jgi:hypothetical protein